jgi:hypothetical protein
MKNKNNDIALSQLLSTYLDMLDTVANMEKAGDNHSPVYAFAKLTLDKTSKRIEEGLDELISTIDISRFYKDDDDKENIS